jgi:hypothetical protein
VLATNAENCQLFVQRKVGTSSAKASFVILSRRAWLRSALGVATFSVLVACAAPTLPLPPPAIPTIDSGSTPLTIRLSSGGAIANALIVVVNRNTNLPGNERVAGAIADASGNWSLEIRASSGDVLELTQEVDSAQSPPVTFVVP